MSIQIPNLIYYEYVALKLLSTMSVAIKYIIKYYNVKTDLCK